MSADVLEKIAKLVAEANDAAKAVKSAEQLTDFESKYLGRKSTLNDLLRNVKDLPAEDRKNVGSEANKAYARITAIQQDLYQGITEREYNDKLVKERLDVSAVKTSSILSGGLHPLSKERFLVEDIFTRMGFAIHEPRMIDDEYNNFTALNIPENHPAKDMWDTIWTERNQYLITHTSSMQHRILANEELPIRAIVPGKCFRNEATDRTHEHTFMQVEGIYVDRGIKISDLIGVMQEFLNTYFDAEVEMKIQPTYFPFVEPGMEVMISYDYFLNKLGLTDSPLKGKWLELIPCGPIHPAVLTEAGLDPQIYSGFAWGFGLERLVLLKYAIDDIRVFNSGRLDFIRQFN